MKMLLFATAFALCSSGVIAQQPTGNEITIIIGPVTVSAQTINTDSYTTKARGNVRFELKTSMIKLDADELEMVVERETGLVELVAKGHVRSVVQLSDGSTRTRETDKLELKARFNPK
jgi:hypothetical protein